MGMRPETCLWGALSMRNLVLGISLAGLVGALASGPRPVLAGTRGPASPFEATIAASRLVVVATTELHPDGSIVVVIERVLAGVPPRPQLVFAAPVDAPALVDGGRAVIAFSTPTSIDADAPTRAWQISADGYVDP